MEPIPLPLPLQPNYMRDEIIRLKRRMYEIEAVIEGFDLQFEKYKIEKQLHEIVRLGKLIEFDSNTHSQLLKTAVNALKGFIAEVEQTNEYKEEVKKDEEENG